MQQPSHPFLDWDGPIPMAHRGGASEAPENTMVAFQRAIDLGYRYIETDVQVTTDGVLVAFHDNDLLRTTGRPGRISKLPWATVREYQVDGRERIPLLDELLDAWPEARINIDCKTDAAAPALVEVLQRHRALPRVCVGAFNDLRLRRLRRALGPDLCTAMGPAGVTALLSGRMRSTAAQALQVPVRYGRIPVTTQRSIQQAHDLGMAVHIWTIDDPAEMARLLDLGVDGIMTDEPAMLRQVMSNRGVWRQ